MADVRTMLAVMLLMLLLLELCVVHGFVVEQPDGPDSAWRFSVDGDEPVLAHEQGGHLVGELKDFQIKGFESYDAGRGGNVNQFSDHTFADLPEQFSSTRDVSANQFQEQFGTQEDSSSGDEPGYVYNARLQSTGASVLETNDVNVAGANAESDGADSYDYNRFSTPASQFNRDQSSSASYVLGVSEEREEEARPDYVYDARAGSTDSGNHGGNADDASFTSTDSVQQQESSDDQIVPEKGHEGPVSYYTPASDRNGAFVFYDTRSDEEKKLSSEVDGDSPGSASFASSDTTTSASTSPIDLAPQRAPQANHGCPNSYWAEHVEQWPAPFKITTLVSQAFGASTVKKNLEIIYGTTTLFQALLDTRDDPYSKLLRHAVAALLNAHAKTAGYTLRPDDVARLFNAALASKAAAAAQAQKFENENHAFGDNECK